MLDRLFLSETELTSRCKVREGEDIRDLARTVLSHKGLKDFEPMMPAHDRSALRVFAGICQSPANL
jgi:hypothetical protein